MSFEAIIDELERKSAANLKVGSDDYIDEESGLLYCGKCHTAKQCRVTIFGRERTPYCICKCEADKRQAEEEAKRRAAFEEKIKELRKMGFPESDMAKWTFENDDGGNEKISNAMRNYVENFGKFREEGKGLLLYGNVGTGKTYMAACVANALIDLGVPCLVTSFPRVVNILQSTFEKQEYLDDLNRFQLIVFDDLATERDTSFMNEQIFQIVDARYRANLPMIITTNLTAEELKSPADISKQRIYNRILERCHPIKVENVNRRNQKLKNGFDEMQKMLGLDWQRVSNGENN